MKKEIPILFSTPMVQAILDGRKVQTRRIVKRHNPFLDDAGHFCTKDKNGKGWNWGKDFITGKPYTRNFIHHHCPYGKAGDVLWVRESWAAWTRAGRHESYMYRASDDGKYYEDAYKIKWKPSIHMPKDACRIFLEITDVRVERLQGISEEDARAEGVEVMYKPEDKELWCYKNYMPKVQNPSPLTYTARYSFLGLWQSINGEESWNSNPFVWVVSFKVLSTTGKPQSITSKLELV